VVRAADALAVLAAFNALSRQKHTMSAELVNRALLDIDRDPAESANLALAAMDQDPANAGAEEALRQALADLEVAHTEAILSLGRPVLDARYSRDGTQLIVASGKTVTLFDARTFEQMGQTYGRNGTVQNAWLIADRKNLITQTDDGQVQMQRIGDSVVRRLSCSGETNRDYSVAVSPDERYVGIGCQDGVVRIWDMAQPDREPQEIGHAGRYTVTALAFSADDEYLASGDASGVVDIWKIGRAGVWIGRGVGGDKAPKIEHDGQNAIREVAFHPSDDNLLVTAGDDNQAIVWQLSLESQRLALDEKKHPKRWVLKHNRPVIHARFVERPDGENPVVTVSGKVVRLWLDEKADISPVRGHDDWVFDANVSSDGEQLVTASNDGTARIWSTRSGAPVAVLRGHRNAVNRAVFSPDGHQVVTASSDGTVRVWRIRPPRLLLYENHWVLSATFEPGGSRIAVGEEGPAVILDPSEGGAAKRDYLTQTEQEDEVFGISWSRDRRLLIGQRGSNHLDRIGNFNPVVIWDVQSKREITPDWLKGYRAATFGPGTDEVLTVNEKGQLAIWKSNGLASGEKPSLEVPEFGDGYASAAMSPDGAWIAATNYSNNNVDLWRREALKEGPQVLAAHRGDVNSLRFSGDSRRLVTASSDRTAIVWSVETSAPVAVLAEGHSGTLEWASFDPSGTRVATASTDGTIHVWDVSQVKTLGVLRWHREAVDQVEFSADGKWILSAGDDGAVNLGQCDECGLSTAELPERVRELAKLPTDQLARINQANDPLRLFDFLKSLLPR
jgi:WD40 repeat protein